MLTVIDKAKMFKEIVNEMANLYEKKNANYGDSFGQLFDALGPISGLVPLHNKLDRATSLIKGNKNNFESLEDTFKDLACYAIMNLIEMKVRNQKITSKGTLTTIPGVVELDFNPNTTATVKDPCLGCPWNGRDFGNLYVGDTPCQWCEHGTKITCGNTINYCTSTTMENTDNIQIKATSSTGLEDAIVGSVNPTTASSIMKDGTGKVVSLETSGIIDEYWDVDLGGLYPTNTQNDDYDFEDLIDDEYHDLDDLTVEKRSVCENVYGKSMRKRRDK